MPSSNDYLGIRYCLKYVYHVYLSLKNQPGYGAAHDRYGTGRRAPVSGGTLPVGVEELGITI